MVSYAIKDALSRKYRRFKKYGYEGRHRGVITLYKKELALKTKGTKVAKEIYKDVMRLTDDRYFASIVAKASLDTYNVTECIEEERERFAHYVYKALLEKRHLFV